MEQSIEQISILENIKMQFGLKEIDVNSYSPLTLAYIGDSIFDIVIKTVIVETANCPANLLHRKTSQLVKAETQSLMSEHLLPLLTEEEENIFRRGRNAKSHTAAKNASITDYRKATGLEALMGYLYLNGRIQRLVELVKTGVDAVDSSPSAMRSRNEAGQHKK